MLWHFIFVLSVSKFFCIFQELDIHHWFSPGKHWTPHLLEKGQYPANGRIKKVSNYSFKFNDIAKIRKIWIEIPPKVFNCSSKLNIIARTLSMTFNLGLMGLDSTNCIAIIGLQYKLQRLFNHSYEMSKHWTVT